MTKTDSPPEWMTIEEVASYLKLSRSKLYAMAQRDEIPCSKVAGQWRFFRPEIDEWMLRQRAPRRDHTGADPERTGPVPQKERKE